MSKQWGITINNDRGGPRAVVGPFRTRTEACVWALLHLGKTRWYAHVIVHPDNLREVARQVDCELGNQTHTS